MVEFEVKAYMDRADEDRTHSSAHCTSGLHQFPNES